VNELTLRCVNHLLPDLEEIENNGGQELADSHRSSRQTLAYTVYHTGPLPMGAGPAILQGKPIDEEEWKSEWAEGESC
jgi:hypothetical protein